MIKLVTVSIQDPHVCPTSTVDKPPHLCPTTTCWVADEADGNLIYVPPIPQYINCIYIYIYISHGFWFPQVCLPHCMLGRQAPRPRHAPHARRGAWSTRATLGGAASRAVLRVAEAWKLSWSTHSMHTWHMSICVYEYNYMICIIQKEWHSYPVDITRRNRVVHIIYTLHCGGFRGLNFQSQGMFGL